MSAALGVGAFLLMVFAGVCMGACVRTHWKSPSEPLRRVGRIAEKRRTRRP